MERALQMKTISKDRLILLLKWTFINVLLPILPIFIRLIIASFSTIKIEVFSTAELLYFNLLVCIIVTNLLQNRQSCFEYIFGRLLDAIMILDIILLVILYSNSELANTSTMAFVLAAIVPILAIVYKRYRIYEKEGEKNDN